MSIPPMVVETIEEEVKLLLTDKAKLAFSQPKATQLTTYKDGSPYTVCKFLGVRTRAKSLGVVKIAQAINDIVEEYNIVSQLCPPSQIELHNPDNSPQPVIATVYYFHLTMKEAEEFDKRVKLSLKEGATPEETETTSDHIALVAKHGLDKMDQ